MEIARLADLRPRFVWDILDDAFDVYRERFAALCGIALAANLPYALVEIGRSVAEARRGSAASDEGWGWYTGLLVTIPLYMATRVVESAATAYVISERLQDRDTTFLRAYTAVLRRWPSVLGAAALAALFGFLGALVLGVGAIWPYLLTSFIGPVLVLEGRRAWGAWKRSQDLASSEASRVFGVLALMFLVTLAVGLGLTLVMQGVYELVPTFGGTDGAAREAQQEIAESAALTLTSTLLVPLESAAVALLYFDLRVRREGIDLAALAEEQGVALAPDPFGDVSSARVVKQQRRRRPREAKKPPTAPTNPPPGATP